MKTMILVILTAAITNNYVLVKFLGICPFLGVAKKLDQATGMSLAVIFVEVLATAVTWPIYHFLLAGKGDFTYMETVVFILVIAALVQLVEIVLKRYVPALHKSLGVYLPLITTNCGVLGVTMNVISDGMNYGEALLTALGCGLGFFLAMVLFSGVRSRVAEAEPPKSFEGLPITLVSAAIVSLSFFGLTGIIDRLFGLKEGVIWIFCSRSWRRYGRTGRGESRTGRRTFPFVVGSSPERTYSLGRSHCDE